jgi:hypothetical protein
MSADIKRKFTVTRTLNAREFINMNTRKIFSGLTALLLAIGLVLAGCEGPTGADGSSGGGANGAPVLGGAISAGQLEAAFVAADTVYVGGGSAWVAASGGAAVKGEVPAGKTLRVVGNVSVGIGTAANSALGDTFTVKGTLEIQPGAAFAADHLASDAATTSTSVDTGTLAIAPGGKVVVNGDILPDATFITALQAAGSLSAAGLSFGSAGSVNLGATATPTSLINALFGAGVPVVKTGVDLIKNTLAATGLTGLTAGKKLVLTATNTLNGALDISTVGGTVVVASGGTLAAIANNITTSSGGNLVIDGTLSAAAATLTGKIDARNGALVLTGNTVLNADFVDNKIGALSAATGTVGPTGTGLAKVTAIGTVTLVTSSPALTLPATVTSISKIVAQAASASLVATEATHIGEVVLSASSPGLTIASVSKIDKLSVTATATLVAGALTEIDEVAATDTITLPATAVTIGSITGTAVVTLANTAPATIGSIAQTGAGGLNAATTATTVNGAATIGTGGLVVGASGGATFKGLTSIGGTATAIGAGGVTFNDNTTVNQLAAVTQGTITVKDGKTFNGIKLTGANLVLPIGTNVTAGPVVVLPNAGLTVVGQTTLDVNGALSGSADNTSQVLTVNGAVTVGASGSIVSNATIRAKFIDLGANTKLTAGALVLASGTSGGTVDGVAGKSVTISGAGFGSLTVTTNAGKLVITGANTTVNAGVGAVVFKTGDYVEAVDNKAVLTITCTAADAATLSIDDGNEIAAALTIGAAGGNLAELNIGAKGTIKAASASSTIVGGNSWNAGNKIKIAAGAKVSFASDFAGEGGNLTTAGAPAKGSVATDIAYKGNASNAWAADT